MSKWCSSITKFLLYVKTHPQQALKEQQAKLRFYRQLQRPHKNIQIIRPQILHQLYQVMCIASDKIVGIRTRVLHGKTHDFPS